MPKDHKTGDFLKHEMSFAAQTTELPDGFIAGIASSPSVDAYGHRVLPGAFDKSIHKRGFDGNKGGIKLLDHHDDKKPPIGVIKKLQTVGKNLHIEAEFCLKSARVRDMYEETKFAGGMGFSVGFRLSEFEFAEESGEEIFLIKEGDLREVSLVNFPACSDAQMTFVKQEAQNDNAEFEAWLAEMQEAITSLKDTSSVSDLERALVAKGLAQGRNEAHKLFVMMKACTHLLRDKSTHAGGESNPPPHPLLDASMLKPVLDGIARVQSLL